MMASIFMNPWVLAFYGWLVYQVILLWKNQKIFDKNDDGYSWDEIKHFLKKHAVGMLLSFMLIPLMVPFAKTFWGWGMQYSGLDWPFSDVAYTGVGALVIILQWLLSKFIK